MLSLLRQKTWSPYVAGTMLGLVYVASIAGASLIPGASGSFGNLASIVASAVAPTLAANPYFQFVKPPEVTWAVLMVVGMIFGAFISAKLSGAFKVATVSDPQWIKMFGPARWKRWLAAFLGAVVIEYGAGIAGGCTSGLAVGGGLFLAPSAFIFMAGMFASGIPTAILLYRRRY